MRTWIAVAILLAGCLIDPPTQPLSRPISPESPLATVALGMGTREVAQRIGEPSDTHEYVTPQGSIPFYGGSDAYEVVHHYAGVGRIVFASGPGNPNLHVIRLEEDASETGFFRSTPGGSRVHTGMGR